MAGRDPIFNGLLQSDLDCNHFRLINLNNPNTRVAVLDLNGDDSTGSVNQASSPFKTLGAALSALILDQHANQNDPAGYVLQVHPGTYPITGMQEVHVFGLTILAHNAIFQCPTGANEETKLLLTSNNITIEGLTIDGGVGTIPSGYDNADVQHGLIEVLGSTGVVLRNCTLQNAVAAGVCGVDDYDNITIEGCDFSTCQNGVFLANQGNQIHTATISGGTINQCRINGIKVTGSANSTSKIGITAVQIQGVVMSQNNTNNNAVAATIFVTGYTDGCRISENHIDRGGDGIRLAKTISSSIAGNVISTQAGAAIHLDGCKNISLDGNLIDGGGTNTGQGILVEGNYAAAFDNGPFTITGNLITGYVVGGRAIYATGSNDLVISGNRFDNYCLFVDCRSVRLMSNSLSSIFNALIPLTFSTTARSLISIFISGNRFETGITVDSLIKFVDSGVFGISGLFIAANGAPAGQVYSHGIIDATGAAPTSVFISGNIPQSTTITSNAYDPRNGWVNDAMVAMSSTQFQILGTKVVGQRRTGWTAPTGILNRGTFDPATVTLAQGMQRLAALEVDLIFHGLIGT